MTCPYGSNDCRTEPQPHSPHLLEALERIPPSPRQRCQWQQRRMLQLQLTHCLPPLQWPSHGNGAAACPTLMVDPSNLDASMMMVTQARASMPVPSSACTDVRALRVAWLEQAWLEVSRSRQRPPAATRIDAELRKVICAALLWHIVQVHRLLFTFPARCKQGTRIVKQKMLFSLHCVESMRSCNCRDMPLYAPLQFRRVGFSHAP